MEENWGDSYVNNPFKTLKHCVKYNVTSILFVGTNKVQRNKVHSIFTLQIWKMKHKKLKELISDSKWLLVGMTDSRYMYKYVNLGFSWVHRWHVQTCLPPCKNNWNIITLLCFTLKHSLSTCKLTSCVCILVLLLTS